MTDELFRALLDLLGAIGPWPVSADAEEEIGALINRESANRGYDTWHHAYREFEL